MNRLIVEYNGVVNRQLDDDLNKVLEKYKFKSVGSGFCFRSGVRDIEYQKGENNEQ